MGHSNNHLLTSLTELQSLAVKRQWTQTAGAVLGTVWRSTPCPGRMSESNQPQDLALIKELELILDSCTLELTPVDEVWPNLYIGNVWVPCVCRVCRREAVMTSAREKLISFIVLLKCSPCVSVTVLHVFFFLSVSFLCVFQGCSTE